MPCSRLSSVVTSIAAILLGCISAAGSGAASEPCGSSTPCTFEGGSYFVRMPEGTPNGALVGAVVYMHGWQSSALQVMRFADLNKQITQLGFALIAPDGDQKTWSFPGSPSQHRDEFAFFDSLLEDVVRRFPIDEGRLIASGFSMGGSMAWYLACERSSRFAGFVPIAGAFWRPHPRDCKGPAPMIVHVHGTTDTVVPMTGRPIGGNWHQGDVRKGFELWATKADCPQPVQITATRLGPLDCETYIGCRIQVLELCLHDGGHSVRAEWLARGIQRIADARGWALEHRISEPKRHQK